MFVSIGWSSWTFSMWGSNGKRNLPAGTEVQWHLKHTSTTSRTWCLRHILRSRKRESNKRNPIWAKPLEDYRSAITTFIRSVRHILCVHENTCGWQAQLLCSCTDSYPSTTKQYDKSLVSMFCDVQGTIADGAATYTLAISCIAGIFTQSTISITRQMNALISKPTTDASFEFAIAASLRALAPSLGMSAKAYHNPTVNGRAVHRSVRKLTLQY